MRYWLLFFLSVLALFGSVVAALATTHARNTDLHGYTNPASTSELPFRVPLVGVNRDLLTLPEDQLLNELTTLDESGVRWIRQTVDWSQIETVEGEFQWSEWDRLTDTMSLYPDIQLIATITGLAEWAQQTSSDNHPILQNPMDYAGFVEQFASRYGEVIDYYQIWDRLDLQRNESRIAPTLSEYISMLAFAYPAIHASDLQAFILSAELGTTTNKSSLPIDYGGVIREFYTLQGNEFVDGIAYDTNDFYTLPYIRDIMTEHGDNRKPLWLTSLELEVSETMISDIDRLSRQWAWLGGVILNNESNNMDFTIQNIPQNGLYPAQNPYTTYHGIWNFNAQGADAGWVNDSQLTFNFFGSDISLLVREGDFSTYFYATIDGKPANALPQDSEDNAYLLLTSDTLSEEINNVPIAHNLDNGEHQLRIIVNELIPDAPLPTYPLIGFSISSNDYTQPYNQQITVAWMVSVVALVSVLFTAAQLPTFMRDRSQPRFTKWISYPLKGIISAIASLFLMLGMLFTWGMATPQLFRRDEVQLLLSLATAGLIYLEPPLIIAIIASLVLFLIIYNHLEIGLMLTLFWSPFFLFPVELYRFAFPTAEIILLITTAAWILHLIVYWAMLIKEDFRFLPMFSTLKQKINPLDYAVGLWVLLGIFAFIGSAYRGVALTELRTIFIQPALYYMIYRSLPHKRQTNIHIVDTLILAGLVVATIGLFQYVRGEAIIEAEGGARRLASVYGSPNNVSLFIGRCFPFALAYTLIPTSRLRRSLSVFTLGVFTVALLLTQSVGALLIGIPATIVAIMIFIYRRKAILPLVLLAIIGIVAFLFALQFPRFNNLLDFSQGTNFYRLRVWESAINIIEDHPMSGIGLDQFLYAFRGQYIMPDAWQEPNLSHPHNFILDIWLRLGIFGVVWFIGTLVVFWKTCLRQVKYLQNQNTLTFALLLGVMGAIINLLAHGMVDNSLFVIDLAYVFMTLLAISATTPNISAIDVTS